MTQASAAIGGAAFGRDASVLAVLGQTLLLFALTTLPTPLYGDYAREFHFSVLTLTLIYAVYSAGTLSTLLLFGPLSDRIGRRPVALLAIAGAALAALLFALAANTATLFAARLVTGLATGLSSGTAVAWLRELHDESAQKTASLRTVAINLLGLGFGPLLCGLLAATGFWPGVLPYIVFLLLLAVLAAVMLHARETVASPKSLGAVQLHPRIGVPSGQRVAFLAPGLICFVIYSLVGFYSALTPGLLAHGLHITSHLVSGSLVFLFFLAGVLTVYATAGIGCRAVMIWGAGLMLPALAMLVLSELYASLPILVAGSVIGGISLGAGYRGALEVTNRLATADRRAELLSMLFVCGNMGMALPVIGVGVLTSLTNARLADLAFAGVIALLSLTGLGFGFGVAVRR
ncbi:MAG TPA: MFS transporter [Rhizomicrobium sp.]